jgi:hypothetical protein
MGTITKTVQQHMERCQHMHMMLDELTQPRREDTAAYFWEHDRKNGTSKWSVPAVVQPQMNTDSPAPPVTTFGEHMESLDSVPGISHWPQGTARSGSSHSRLGSVKLLSNWSILSGEPVAESDLSMLLKAMSFETVSF